ncbi:sugar transporter family protein [Heterostelium album PN500]|uniref:Sugar transporter family protein n=1 Tax=Heterostelium pallidum (strain ATCC 26659 / Pp 5 / PN500) TaxID=670386 RepID=D3B4H8_HETP5|nr:sugar transporter family protein [Heterostelium album PN500]EFA84226.1 sugar transporter family protein [Heterostelium album PN500]|eukprot:XP_020436342.1 sugar transporter family protein [Heterostelium album PN500]
MIEDQQTISIIPPQPVEDDIVVIDTLRKRIGYSRLIVVTLSAMGGLIFGYNTGVISGSLPLITREKGLNTVQQGLVVCSVLLGALIGSVAGGLIANVIGRKPVILFTAITCIGGAVSSAAVSPLGLQASLRIILGLSVGCASAVCPLMVAEVVPENKRGRFGSVFQIFITIGLLWGNVMGIILRASPHGWRWMWAVGAVPGFGVLVIWFLILESPKWINERKRKVARDKELRLLGQKDPSPWTILREPRNRRPMAMGVILATFSQLTGINAFMYFSTIIFEFAGFDQEYGPITGSTILQFWNVLTTFIAMFLVDRVGRRILLFTGSIIMTACDLLIAIFFVTLTGAVRGWLSIVALFTFVAAFEASIGTLFWFVINEILDDDVKNIGAPIITGLQWLFNMLLSFLFLSAVRYIGKSTMFWVFFGIGLFCIIALAIWLPPEKGKTTMGVADDDPNGGPEAEPSNEDEPHDDQANNEHDAGDPDNLYLEESKPDDTFTAPLQQRKRAPVEMEQ